MRMWFSLTLQAKASGFIRATIISRNYQHRLFTLQTYDFGHVDGWESSKENPHPTNRSAVRFNLMKEVSIFFGDLLELD